MSYLKTLIIILGVSVCIVSKAQSKEIDGCKTTSAIQTTNGSVAKLWCEKDGFRYRDTIMVDGSPVLSASRLYSKAENDSFTQWIYTSDEMDSETGCYARVYLIDLTFRPVKVIAFGVKNACTEFDSAVFLPKRTVIKLKETTKFIYENGKMKLPSGPKIWNTVRPSQKNFSVESSLKAVAFSEEVPPPK